MIKFFTPVEELYIFSEERVRKFINANWFSKFKMENQLWKTSFSKQN